MPPFGTFGLLDAQLTAVVVCFVLFFAFLFLSPLFFFSFFLLSFWFLFIGPGWNRIAWEMKDAGVGG